MIAFAIKVLRCALWAGMGMGKTSSVLAVIDTLLLAGLVRKVVVFAPLRVARDTWPNEAKKWKQFAGMRIAFIEWTAAEREFLRARNGYLKLLKRDEECKEGVTKTARQHAISLRPAAVASRMRVLEAVDVLTVNYDIIQQITAIFGDEWPFDMVVADESTRLKGLRAKQGAKRAQKLAKIAFTHVKRWINLTGTPSPNGLVDLWGQTWYLDQGKRLERSFSAFQNRWFGFKRAKDAIGYKPGVERIVFPHAQAEIQALLKDICITMDPKDWFDLDVPIVRTVEVELPARARQHYREMERAMFTEIEGNAIEAFAAAAKTMKCIAAGTEVLTDRGWVRIEHVTANHLVWDGVEWVSTDGVAFNGYETVVQCCGVFMTPDHQVLTTVGWWQAQEILDADASERPDREIVRLPDSIAARGVVEPAKVEASNVALPMRLWQRGRADRGQSGLKGEGPEEVLRVQTRRDAARRVGYSRHDKPPRVDYMEQHEVTLHKPQRQGLAQLRRAWYFGVQKMVVGIRQVLGRHGPNLETEANVGPHQERQELHPQELPLGDCRSAVEQPSRECFHRHAERSNDFGPSSASFWGERCDSSSAHKKRVVSERRIKTPVFDIVNAGPRHRFTVRGSDGNLVVHNCLQLANGAAYVGDGNTEWVVVHDEKLDALESIVEEAAGMPVLVAYHFKSDLARLKKRFGADGIDLSTKEGMARAMAGEGRVWFGHPAGMGHGVDGLQYHCNIIAFFGHNWNLEERLQIIERVGPMRQKQAGKERPCFTYNIVAKGTVDELVLKRVESKRSVQDILLDAMKHSEPETTA
jgi:hypothetical protein